MAGNQVDLDVLDRIVAEATKAKWEVSVTMGGVSIRADGQFGELAGFAQLGDANAAAALKNAYPAIAAELRELREWAEIDERMTAEVYAIAERSTGTRGWHNVVEAAEAMGKKVERIKADNAKLAWAWDKVQDENAFKAADKAKTINAAAVCLNALAWLAARDRRMKRLGAEEELRELAPQVEAYQAPDASSVRGVLEARADAIKAAREDHIADAGKKVGEEGA